ncbi:MAG: uridine kinase [Bacteroidota bacterium]
MKPLTIGISGGSGAGKTTFIKKISDLFPPHQVCIISQDDYYRSRDEVYIDQEGWKNFDLPNSIDDQAFYEDIVTLIKGEDVSRQEYVYNNESKGGLLTFKSAPIIIVEGILVFHFEKIKELCDLRLFIDAKDNLKLIRRIKRDREERNYDLKEILYRYEHHVLPTYEKYIYPHIEDVDMIINNNRRLDKALDVFEGYLNNHLAKFD